LQKLIKQRNIQSKMLLSLSFGFSVGILPFAIYRAYNHDWKIAILDIFVVIGMGLIFIYIYKTDNVKNASLVIIIVALIGNVVSFYIKGIAQINWIYPGMLMVYFVVSPKKGLLLNFILLALFLPKLIMSLEIIDLATTLMTIMITNIIAYAFASGLRQQEDKLKKMASEDYLTGAGNRRALSLKVEELQKTLRNHDKTATLILIDLDYFKKINDTYGHIQGDEVLIKMVELLGSHFKESNCIFRYGGEEFLVICSNVNIHQAYKKAQEFRQVYKNNIIIDDQEQTISIGVAEYSKEESNEEWIHRVDLALYQAKNEGRDRVIQV